MTFLRSNIDRAIVMTQYDLRGFAHPLGYRNEYMSSAKALYVTTGNLTAFAAGVGGEGSDAVPECFVYYTSKNTYEAYLAMCKSLAQDCEASQKEAIQFIIQEIVRQSEFMKAEVASGKREKSAYLEPLEKSNRWGIAVLALAEAFEVSLAEPIAV